VKIKILKTVPASLDGVNVREFLVDEIVEIHENQPRAVELAHSLSAAGYAEIVSDAEAAEHVKAISELHPEEAAALKVDREVFDQLEKNADRADRKAKRESRGKGRKSAAVEPVSGPIANVTPATSAPSSKPADPPVALVVGDVVQGKGAGPFMTIEEIEPELALSTCVWFAEGDHTAPKRDVFPLADLVKVKGN
jgi:uncharacterized protein YodC (DUF2158 family)